MVDLFILTYNCAKKPPFDDNFFDSVEKKLPNGVSDLYVFGFQEVSSLLNSTSNSKIQSILLKISNSFITKLVHKYDIQTFKNICCCNIGAIGLIIISPYPRNVEQIYKSIGYPVGHVYTTLKGGIGCRIKYQGTEFTFVSMHLNAGEQLTHVLRRNSDLADIIANLAFADGWCVLKPEAHCFIFGDLNYRATNAHGLVGNEADDTDSVNVNQSLKRDELSLLKNECIILEGFDEAGIEFNPTYKKILGNREYIANRIPSYCDRIMFLEHLNESNLSHYKVSKYDAIEECQISDHVPVYLEVQIPETVPKINSSQITIQNRLLLKKNSRIIVISNITTWIMGTGIYLTTTNQGRGLGILVLLLFYGIYKNFSS